MRRRWCVAARWGIALSLLCVGAAEAYTDEGLVRAYADSTHNIRIVTRSGRDLRVTTRSRYSDVHLAPDGKTYGALVVGKIDTGMSGGEVEVSEKLLIYRNRRIIRSISPGAFIRAWGFRNRAREVAVYYGGLHFAGVYSLFDLDSGREIATSKDPNGDESPDWVRAFEE